MSVLALDLADLQQIRKPFAQPSVFSFGGLGAGAKCVGLLCVDERPLTLRRVIVRVA